MHEQMRASVDLIVDELKQLSRTGRTQWLIRITESEQPRGDHQVCPLRQQEGGGGQSPLTSLFPINQFAS